jgi:hypothetical protein
MLFGMDLTSFNESQLTITAGKTKESLQQLNYDIVSYGWYMRLLTLKPT